MAELFEITELQKRVEKELFRRQNVIGVGVGFKESAGVKTEELSLLVMVQEKIPLTALSEKDVVPKDFDGIRTDVLRVGKVVAYQTPRDRWRPAPAGVSIGHYAITAGTFGAVVRDATSNEMLLLSNNHVMANSNNAKTGDAIIQPGAADGGRAPQDRIADLLRFVPIKYKSSNGGGSDCSAARFLSSFLNSIASLMGSKTRMTAIHSDPTNLVDAAVARPWQTSIIDPQILGIGQVNGTAQAAVGMAVQKSGRTTGKTQGSISALNATIEVGYGGNQIAKFVNQIVSNDMSEPGDSGSLLLDMQSRAVGLLFAGSDEITVFNPIDAVLSALNIKF